MCGWRLAGGSVAAVSCLPCPEPTASAVCWSSSSMSSPSHWCWWSFQRRGSSAVTAPLGEKGMLSPPDPSAVRSTALYVFPGTIWRNLSSKSGVPNLWDLMPDDLRWSWCNNYRNKVHNKCNVLESSWNHLPPVPWVHGKIIFHETSLGAAGLNGCQKFYQEAGVD